jgi:cephalosporin-C deacetylase
MIDDRVGISLGAFYYADAPVKLSTVVRRDAMTIEGTDGARAIRYLFGRDQVKLILDNRGTAPIPYFVVLSPDITIVKNLRTGEAAAAPANERWSDVSFHTKRGAFLNAQGGSRVWGPWLGRQVWEVTRVEPGRQARLILQGGLGEQPKATLEQLLGVEAEVLTPEAPAPELKGIALAALVDNRSEEGLDGLVSMELSACRGDMVMLTSSPLKLPPKQVSKATFQARVETPDFYTARVIVMAKGREASKTTAVAGYRVAEIRPTATRPSDFQQFWQRVLAEAEQEAPSLSLRPDRGRSRGGVSVSVAGYVGLSGKAIHGWYLVPEQAGKYPAILYLSGYGARPITPPVFLAQQGYAVLAIDVRGNAVDRPRAKPFEDYSTTGIESPESYVYREIVGHALRALRALAAREEADPSRLAVVGVSEGGGVGLMLAALDTRVRAVTADAPLLVDFPLSLRCATWPYSGIAQYLRQHGDAAPAMLHTLSYFDVVNFAPEVRCPALISVGFLDQVSLPAAVYGMYNLLGGPKEMRPFPHAGHEGGGQELWAYKLVWLAKQLAPQ